MDMHPWVYEGESFTPVAEDMESDEDEAADERENEYDGEQEASGKKMRKLFFDSHRDRRI